MESLGGGGVKADLKCLQLQAMSPAVRHYTVIHTGNENIKPVRIFLSNILEYHILRHTETFITTERILNI